MIGRREGLLSLHRFEVSPSISLLPLGGLGLFQSLLAMAAVHGKAVNIFTKSLLAHERSPWFGEDGRGRIQQTQHRRNDLKLEEIEMTLGVTFMT